MKKKELKGYSLLEQKALREEEELRLNLLKEEIRNWEKATDKINTKSFYKVLNYVNNRMPILMATDILKSPICNGYNPFSVYDSEFRHFKSIFNNGTYSIDRMGLVKDSRGDYYKILPSPIKLKKKEGIF